MTVQDLIDTLEGLDPEAQVRLAFQPSHPMQYTIGDVVEVDDDDEGDVAVFLAEGSAPGPFRAPRPYLPRAARIELGW
jgi:hypothetical protein